MGFFDSAFNILGDIGTTQMDMATMGGFSNAKGIQNANDQNAANAKYQMDFQERMSNTGYQRGVADMRAAGLNPALAYQNGPASAPSGAMATAQAERKGDIGGGLGANAAKTVGLNAEVQNANSQTALNKENTAVAEANVGKVSASAKETETNTRKLEEDLKTSKETAKIRKNEREVSDAELPSRKTSAPVSVWADVIGKVFGTANTGKKAMLNESLSNQQSRNKGPGVSGWRGSKIRKP